MVTERKHIDLDDAPDLAAIVAEVRASGRPYVLTQAGEEVAVVSPPREKPPKRKRPPRKDGIIRADDSIWNIVGISNSDGPGDVATNKHKYLAEAYLPRTE